MVPHPKIPNLTRVNKMKGEVHDDLGIKGVFDCLCPRLTKSRWDHYRRLEELFLYFYDQDNATYRRDFLGEFLENSEFESQMKKIYPAIPLDSAKHVRTEDRWGNELTDKEIRRQIGVIKKYIEITDTLEVLGEISGVAQGTIDLKRFALRSRKSLEDYAQFVRPIKKSKQFQDNKTLDDEWANKSLEKIYPYLHRINHITSIKRQLFYYKQLTIPFILKLGGKRIPLCKPIFLEAEKREGRIKNAYHPLYWRMGRERRGRRVIDTVKKLNTPNDILWGDNARANFINGPNSLGKSVYIRTIGLNVHLIMAGLFCFADHGEISFPRKILPCFDIGDTLGAGHFQTGGEKVNYMLNQVRGKDLVLLDETGTGTEPDAERQVAKGVSDGLIKYGITFFNVTHDKGAWGDYIGNGDSRVRMLRVADLDDRKNKFKIWEGIVEGGYGMKLAKKMKIDPNSVDKTLAKHL